MQILGRLRAKIAKYLQVQLDLVKLEFIQRTSVVLSYFIFVFVSLSIGLPLFFFLGLGLAEYFSAITGSRAGGFFMTAGVYLLSFIIIFLVRSKIIRFFAGLFIDVMTEDDNDETNNELDEDNQEEEM
jgi:hypothetical protein